MQRRASPARARVLRPPRRSLRPHAAALGAHRAGVDAGPLIQAETTGHGTVTGTPGCRARRGALLRCRCPSPAALRLRPAEIGEHMSVDAESSTSTPAVDPQASAAQAATRESLEDYTLRFAPRSYRRLGAGRGRHERAGRDRVSRGFLHRCQHRARPRHPERPDRHRRRGRDHLPDRVPAGLLRRSVQPRPRSHHATVRLRISRLGDHQPDLRVLHLHPLRAGGGDHGAGPVPGSRDPALDRLPDLHRDDLPAGHLRHEDARPVAGRHDPRLAGPSW